jgi:hypothetical protein
MQSQVREEFEGQRNTHTTPPANIPYTRNTPYKLKSLHPCEQGVCTEAHSQPLLFKFCSCLQVLVDLELAGNWGRDTNSIKDLRQFSSTLFHNIE